MAIPTSIQLPGHLQRKPLLITAAVHLVLLLLLLIWRFSVPNPTVQLPELGMEVNLGTSANGSGIDQPLDIEDPAAEAAEAAQAEAAEEATQQAELERSNEADAPTVPDVSRNRARRPSNNPVSRRSGNRASTSSTPVTQPQRPRYVYPGSTGNGGNRANANAPGTGEGNTTGPGDRGVPGGTPGASNYEGSPGTGTGGISHSISGRNIISFPPRDARFREGGRVVVRVTVDRDGIIVNKQIRSSSNSELSPIALRKLQQVRFNKSASAPEEQFGDIIFVFKSRQ